MRTAQFDRNPLRFSKDSSTQRAHSPEDVSAPAEQLELLDGKIAFGRPGKHCQQPTRTVFRRFSASDSSGLKTSSLVGDLLGSSSEIAWCPVSPDKFNHH